MKPSEIGDCPFLGTIKKNKMCNASTFHMTPSAFELERYCKTEEHHRCPLILVHGLNHGQRYNDFAFK